MAGYDLVKIDKSDLVVDCVFPLVVSKHELPLGKLWESPLRGFFTRCENYGTKHYIENRMSLATPNELEKFLPGDPHASNDKDNIFLGNYSPFNDLK